MALTVKQVVGVTAEVIASLDTPLSRKRDMAEKMIAALKDGGVIYDWDHYYQEAAGSKGV